MLIFLFLFLENGFGITEFLNLERLQVLRLFPKVEQQTEFLNKYSEYMAKNGLVSYACLYPLTLFYQ